MTPSQKSWHLVAVDVDRAAEEYAGSLLFDLGTTGIVTLEENETSLKLGAYFDERGRADELRRAIEEGFARGGHSRELIGISVSSVPDQDWMEKWKEGFEAVEIGERLVVAPSWRLPETAGGRAVIQIDPGMAFGTGTHETTRLCLEAIEANWRGGRMLDVGTGTGILAIAAALLCPGSRITAIDLDPQAVEVARENAITNGVASSVEILEAQPRDFIGGTFDMVVANLTADVIVTLMEDLAGCLAASGLMILSGVLVEFAADVERAAVAAGLSIVGRRDRGEWTALVARRGDR